MEQIHIAQEAIHKGAGRMVPHLLRRANLLDTAIVHQHHAVGHFHGLFLAVCHKNAGDMQIIVQATQLTRKFFAHFGVERAKRFVEQQHFRLNAKFGQKRSGLKLPAQRL